MCGLLHGLCVLVEVGGSSEACRSSMPPCLYAMRIKSPPPRSGSSCRLLHPHAHATQPWMHRCSLCDTCHSAVCVIDAVCGRSEDGVCARSDHARAAAAAVRTYMHALQLDGIESSIDLRLTRLSHPLCQRWM